MMSRLEYETLNREQVDFAIRQEQRRYWDDVTSDELEIRRCPHCERPGTFTPHYSTFGGMEQEWLTCDECGAAFENHDFERPLAMRKPVQYEFGEFAESELERIIRR